VRTPRHASASLARPLCGIRVQQLTSNTRFLLGVHRMYSDMCNIGSRFVENYVSDTTTAAYQMHYGWNITVAGNTFAGGFIAAPSDSVIYANPSPAMGASFIFTNNTVHHTTNATLLRVDRARAKDGNYSFKGNAYVITGAGKAQFDTGGSDDSWGAWKAIGQDTESSCSDHGVPCRGGGGGGGSRCCCCWDRASQPCNSSSQCDGGGEGCVSKGTITKKYGAANCVCDGLSHGCPA
jgi:hypothetical protein